MGVLDKAKDIGKIVDGNEFATNIFELETDKWVRPVNSQYGTHLVNIAYKNPAIGHKFQKVLKMVTKDLQRERQIELNNLYIEGILWPYEVIVEMKKQGRIKNRISIILIVHFQTHYLFFFAKICVFSVSFYVIVLPIRSLGYVTKFHK